MSKLIETDFTKELSSLLLKYKKTIESDKSGIYFPDDNVGTRILIEKAECGTDDFRGKGWLVSGKFD